MTKGKVIAGLRPRSRLATEILSLKVSVSDNKAWSRLISVLKVWWKSLLQSHHLLLPELSITLHIIVPRQLR